MRCGKLGDELKSYTVSLRLSHMPVTQLLDLDSRLFAEHNPNTDSSVLALQYESPVFESSVVSVQHFCQVCPFLNCLLFGLTVSAEDRLMDIQYLCIHWVRHWMCCANALNVSESLNTKIFETVFALKLCQSTASNRWNGRARLFVYLTRFYGNINPKKTSCW